MKGSSSTHLRLNTGILAAAEKRTLIWLAHRLPQWVNSDHLTLLALVAMAGAGASFWAARYWPPALVLVVVNLAVNWFGDSLDGTLARVRRHERPRYGFYVDHVLDIAGACFLFGGMALSGFMTPVIALTLLAAYLLVAAEVFLATGVNGTFRMSFLSFGPTELRIVLSIGALTLYSHPVISPFGLGPFLSFDVGGVVAIAGLVAAFTTAAVKTTISLYRAEPLPKADGENVSGAGSLRSSVAAVAVAATLIPGASAAATPHPETARAWDTYVARTEERIARELKTPEGFLVSDFTSDAAGTRERLLRGELVIGKMKSSAADGGTIAVPDGQISHWRGSMLLRGVTLEALLDRVQHPSERGPYPQDVLAMRVLGRSPDRLTLAIRMTRSNIVTVTYDTEHEVEYRRYGSSRASSRSIATKIAELDGTGTGPLREKAPGQDRGFMWRLNAYWRYEQVGEGVIVEVESLTLSRSVPFGLSAAVRPMIDRIARESIARTLHGVKHLYAAVVSRQLV